MQNLKAIIRDKALELIQKNGSTTNLDIKTALRIDNANDPNFTLFQSDVSAAMREISKEEGLVENLDSSTRPGVTFTIFSMPTSAAISVSAPTLTSTVSITGNAKVQLDPKYGDKVTYIAGHPEQFAQGNDFKVLRKQAFNLYKSQHPMLTYDDVRRISVENYNKKYC